ncbi:hypothetical protein JCM33374_g2265 [Metschnikowia sp. JCM 33374]|nr:hypothetical protein JCM33374_g2265 [Metschnikowia sp. JCM 33374]
MHLQFTAINQSNKESLGSQKTTSAFVLFEPQQEVTPTIDATLSKSQACSGVASPSPPKTPYKVPWTKAPPLGRPIYVSPTAQMMNFILFLLLIPVFAIKSDPRPTPGFTVHYYDDLPPVSTSMDANPFLSLPDIPTDSTHGTDVVSVMVPPANKLYVWKYVGYYKAEHTGLHRFTIYGATRAMISCGFSESMSEDFAEKITKRYDFFDSAPATYSLHKGIYYPMKVVYIAGIDGVPVYVSFKGRKVDLNQKISHARYKKGKSGNAVPESGAPQPRVPETHDQATQTNLHNPPGRFDRPYVTTVRHFTSSHEVAYYYLGWHYMVSLAPDDHDHLTALLRVDNRHVIQQGFLDDEYRGINVPQTHTPRVMEFVGFMRPPRDDTYEVTVPSNMLVAVQIGPGDFQRRQRYTVSHNWGILDTREMSSALINLNSAHVYPFRIVIFANSFNFSMQTYDSNHDDAKLFPLWEMLPRARRVVEPDTSDTDSSDALRPGSLSPLWSISTVPDLDEFSDAEEVFSDDLFAEANGPREPERLANGPRGPERLANGEVAQVSAGGACEKDGGTGGSESGSLVSSKKSSPFSSAFASSFPSDVVWDSGLLEDLSLGELTLCSGCGWGLLVWLGERPGRLEGLGQRQSASEDPFRYCFGQIIGPEASGGGVGAGCVGNSSLAPANITKESIGALRGVLENQPPREQGWLEDSPGYPSKSQELDLARFPRTTEPEGDRPEGDKPEEDKPVEDKPESLNKSEVLASANSSWTDLGSLPSIHNRSNTPSIVPEAMRNINAQNVVADSLIEHPATPESVEEDQHSVVARTGSVTITNDSNSSCPPESNCARENSPNSPQTSLEQHYAIGENDGPAVSKSQTVEVGNAVFVKDIPPLVASPIHRPFSNASVKRSSNKSWNSTCSSLPGGSHSSLGEKSGIGGAPEKYLGANIQPVVAHVPGESLLDNRGDRGAEEYTERGSETHPETPQEPQDPQKTAEENPHLVFPRGRSTTKFMCAHGSDSSPICRKSEVHNTTISSDAAGLGYAGDFRQETHAVVGQNDTTSNESDASWDDENGTMITGPNIPGNASPGKLKSQSSKEGDSQLVGASSPNSANSPSLR